MLFQFHLRLLIASARWLGPCLLCLTWMALILSSPGTAISAGTALFFQQAMVSCWLAITVGNIDDDPHRDLMISAAGSYDRLHLIRTAAALSVSCVLSAVSVVAVMASAPRAHNPLTTAFTLLVLSVSASTIGTAIGSLLHKPIVKNVGITMIVAIAALLFLISFHPLQRAVFHIGAGQYLYVLPIALCSALLMAVAFALMRPLYRRS